MSDPREHFLRELGYTDTSIAYIIGEKNVGEIENPSVAVRHQGHCGDIMLLQLAIGPDRVIREARYRLTGCAGLQAAGSAVTDMLPGMTIEQAGAMSMEDIIEKLGGSFPDFKLDCVELARDTVHKAAEEYTGASAGGT